MLNVLFIARLRKVPKSQLLLISPYRFITSFKIWCFHSPTIFFTHCCIYISPSPFYFKKGWEKELKDVHDTGSHQSKSLHMHLIWCDQIECKCQVLFLKISKMKTCILMTDYILSNLYRWRKVTNF